MSNCTVLREEEYVELAVVRGISGAVSFLLTGVTLFLSVVVFRSKKSFLDHLFVYLTVVTMFHTGLFVFQMIEEVSSGSKGFCKALGFFLEWVGWVQLSTTCLLAIDQIYILNNTVNKPTAGEVDTSPNPKKWQYIAMLTGWTPLPLLFIWIPFSTSDKYSDPGPWCWIASISEDCSGNEIAFAEEIVMWYIPVLIAGVTSLTLSVLLAAVYCCWACGREHVQQQIPKSLLLMFCYFIFSILCGVELAARTHTALHATHNYALWKVYAILVPWRGSILPMGYAVYLHSWRLRRSRQDSEYTGSYEDSDTLDPFVNIETVTAVERKTLILNLHKEMESRTNRSNTMA